MTELVKQPPVGPFTAEKEAKLDSAIYGGYVIRDGRRRIVAAVPGSDHYSAEATARLLTAGANHLPSLMRRIGESEDTLKRLADLDRDWKKLYDYLISADGTLEDGAGEKDIERAKGFVTKALDLLDRLSAMQDDSSADLLDAYDRACLEAPSP